MAQPSLAPAGSSSYSSDTMAVGDGTWDATHNTFLLPNIMGLNFDTMRYNGMGNRFRQLNGYHSIITGHAIIAAITFLAIVPAAILTASFYHKNPYHALRIHIGLQVLTVILTTVIFVLGYFAVGPERSLTNPHHGIGLTIFLLVLVQAFGGWIIKKIEKGKIRYYIPLKLMLHQWMGRGIALLGFAQIPIGLTLYGSPSILFILYSLWMFALLVLYFILVHRNHKRVALGLEQDERDSYVTSNPSTEVSQYQQDVPEQRRHHRLEKAAGAVGLGAGLAALRRRSSGRHRAVDDHSDLHSSLPPSQAPTASRVTEKFSDSDYMEPRRATWRERFLGPGVALGGLGGLAAGRRFFQRRRTRDDVSDGTSYTAPPPLGGHVNQSALSVNRLEEGRPGPEPPADRWRAVEEREAAQEAALRRAEAQSRLSSDDSYMSYDAPEKPVRRKSRFGLPASLGAITAAGGIGSYFKRRRARREDERVAAEQDAEYENERLYTSPGGQPRFTGDGTPRRNGRFDGPPTPITERTESPGRSRMGASTAGSPMQRSRRDSHGTMQEPYSPSAGRGPRIAIPPPPRSRSRPGSRPPAAPSHGASPSNVYSSPAGHSRMRDDSMSNLNTTTNVIDHGATVSPPPAATATGSMLPTPNPPFAHGRSRSHSSSPQDSNESPVASVKVRMGNDGRHVTLRRLNEEEAAAERAARRREGRSERRDNSHFRREQTPAATPGALQQPSQLSLPPQATPGVSPPSALGAASHGTGAYDTGTDVTDFESNRKRRRAERARAEQARAAKRGGTGHVEFE